MLSDRPQGKDFNPQDSPLSRKLERLQEMLEMTEGLVHDATRESPEASRAFEERMNACILAITALDREQAIHETSTGGVLRVEDEALKLKVKDTLQRLKSANRNLVASIKAQQESIGNKIARLKESKNLIGRYRVNMAESPTLLDSKL